MDGGCTDVITLHMNWTKAEEKSERTSSKIDALKKGKNDCTCA